MIRDESQLQARDWADIYENGEFEYYKIKPADKTVDFQTLYLGVPLIMMLSERASTNRHPQGQQAPVLSRGLLNPTCARSTDWVAVYY